MPYQRVDRTKPIAYLQGDGNYTTLYYADGTTALSSTTLRDVITWQPGLLRINKSNAINPAFVDTYNRYNSKSMSVTMRFANKSVTLETSRRLAIGTEHALRDYELENALPS